MIENGSSEPGASESECCAYSVDCEDSLSIKISVFLNFTAILTHPIGFLYKGKVGIRSHANSVAVPVSGNIFRGSNLVGIGEILSRRESGVYFCILCEEEAEERTDV